MNQQPLHYKEVALDAMYTELIVIMKIHTFPAVSGVVLHGHLDKEVFYQKAAILKISNFPSSYTCVHVLAATKK